jgi:MOSC domain-containing protein YiiM
VTYSNLNKGSSMDKISQPAPAGKVVAIYIAPAQGEPTAYIEQAHLVPGMGIEGDRYYSLSQKSGENTKSGHALTLVEMEAIEAICQQEGIPLTPGQTRRNIVTRGISLNDLVGRVFAIGSIQLRGVKLCEPCSYLAGRTDPRILSSMAKRGGLRADIITEGIIHLNDIIIIDA